MLRQNPRALDADVEAWLAEEEQKIILADALKRYATTSPLFQWRANPVRPTYSRTFTPIPNRERQPAEIIIGLPGALTAEQQAQESMALILSLSHAMRQAHSEGVMKPEIARDEGLLKYPAAALRCFLRWGILLPLSWMFISDSD